MYNASEPSAQVFSPSGFDQLNLESILNMYIRDWQKFLVAERKKVNKKALFLQVGANDGKRNDPLYAGLALDFDAWLGLMVEPASFNFEELKKTHAEREDWSFAKCIVTDKCAEDKKMTSYEYPQKVSADDYDQAKHGVAGVPRWIAIGQGNGLGRLHSSQEETRLPCLDSVLELIDKFATDAFKAAAKPPGSDITHLDILQVDAEKNDWRIIQAVDFDLLRPRVIQFEGYGNDVYRAVMRIFAAKGYYTRSIGSDVLAVDLNFLSSLEQPKGSHA